MVREKEDGGVVVFARLLQGIAEAAEHVVHLHAHAEINSPEFIPDTVIDDKTLAVIGQTASAEAAANMARTLGVSTERITWVEYENMKVRFGKGE